MLLNAMQGAKDAGAEAELVHLYDLDYKGCKSCFACQLKNAKTDGVCAIRDGLRPVLEKAREADVIVIGSNHPKIRHKVSANRMKYQINLSISQDLRNERASSKLRCSLTSTKVKVNVSST